MNVASLKAAVIYWLSRRNLALLHYLNAVRKPAALYATYFKELERLYNYYNKFIGLFTLIASRTKNPKQQVHCDNFLRGLKQPSQVFYTKYVPTLKSKISQYWNCFTDFSKNHLLNTSYFCCHLNKLLDISDCSWHHNRRIILQNCLVSTFTYVKAYFISTLLWKTTIMQ